MIYCFLSILEAFGLVLELVMLLRLQYTYSSFILFYLINFENVLLIFIIVILFCIIILDLFFAFVALVMSLCDFLIL